MLTAAWVWWLLVPAVNVCYSYQSQARVHGKSNGTFYSVGLPQKSELNSNGKFFPIALHYHHCRVHQPVGQLLPL
jgi:hypothetical protein